MPSLILPTFVISARFPIGSIRKRLELIQYGVSIFNDICTHPDFGIKQILNYEQFDDKSMLLRAKINAAKYLQERNWRIANARSLQNKQLIQQLLLAAPVENRAQVHGLLRCYLEQSNYVLLSAHQLSQLTTEILPELEEWVKETSNLLLNAPRKIPKEEIKYHYLQLRQLNKTIQDEKNKIASAMVMRLETAYKTNDLSNDDVLVYTHTKLYQTGALKPTTKLHTPAKTLTQQTFNKFQDYIYKEGTENHKKRLHAVQQAPQKNFATTMLARQEDSVIVPAPLADCVPHKPAYFSSLFTGHTLRYDYFKKHNDVIAQLQIVHQIEVDAQTSLPLLATLDKAYQTIKTQFDEIDKQKQSLWSWFHGESINFLDKWKIILIKQHELLLQKELNLLKVLVHDFISNDNELENNCQTKLCARIAHLKTQLQNVGMGNEVQSIVMLQNTLTAHSIQASAHKSIRESKVQLQLSDSLLAKVSQALSESTALLNNEDRQVQKSEAHPVPVLRS